MKISILTVTYNSAATLRDTIESVRKQDYPNVEHVIVDGQSTDGTLDIIRSYSHIRNWVSEKDNGIYDAMNKGIGMATGDIIGILNSDDIYQDSRVLARVMETFMNEHRSLYERFGTFNTSFKTAADYELMLRFIHKSRASLGYVPHVLVKMREGGASNQSMASRLKANKEDRKAWAVNNLVPYWFTLYLKPLRKIGQYFLRE